MRIIFLLVLFLPSLILADTIAVIGTGRVASALGPAFASQGHEIVYASRSPNEGDFEELLSATTGNPYVTNYSDAVQAADIVVIAVPGPATVLVIEALGDLSGKIIIDPTNRVRTAEDGFREHDIEGSNAELIQSMAPGATVVKAFNTLNYMTMINPGSSGGEVSIPIAGDNVEAKAKVASLIYGMNLEPIDIGPLRYAHILEEMLIVYGNARILGNPFNYYLRPQTD
jgi:predicted dinucleotide-binding enzyme